MKLAEQKSEVSEAYELYKKLVLEETEKILSNKRTFLSGPPRDIDRKRVKIEGLADFFYLEGEDAIVQELDNISNALLIKGLLKF